MREQDQPGWKRRRSIVQTVRRPNGLAIDGSERLWIAEAYEGVIICITSDGRELKRIAGRRLAVSVAERSCLRAERASLYDGFGHSRAGFHRRHGHTAELSPPRIRRQGV